VEIYAVYDAARLELNGLRICSELGFLCQPIQLGLNVDWVRGEKNDKLFCVCVCLFFVQLVSVVIPLCKAPPDRCKLSKVRSQDNSQMCPLAVQASYKGLNSRGCLSLHFENAKLPAAA